MKLGGWTRLWILVSVIYLIPVGVITYSFLPKQSGYQRTRVYETFDVVIQTVPELRDYKWYQLRDIYKDIPDEELIRRVHKKYEGKVQFDKIENEYRRKLDNHRKEQLKGVGKGILVWIVPLTLLYLCGRFIGWVIKGFKEG